MGYCMLIMELFNKEVGVLRIGGFVSVFISETLKELQPMRVVMPMAAKANRMGDLFIMVPMLQVIYFSEDSRELLRRWMRPI